MLRWFPVGSMFYLSAPLDLLNIGWHTLTDIRDGWYIMDYSLLCSEEFMTYMNFKATAYAFIELRHDLEPIPWQKEGF